MEYHVVFHVDEMEKWPLVFGNLHNFLRGVAKTDLVDLHVVANAGAVLAVENEEYRTKICQLAEEGIFFEFCQIAVQGNGLDAKKAGETVQLIPSGIRRLIELQAAGCAYIKP